jgi:hypothetical protein
MDVMIKHQNNKFGFAEPHVMAMACHIGILALKKNKMKIIDELKPLIETFEKAYRNKWIPDESLKTDRVLLFEDKLPSVVYDIYRATFEHYGHLSRINRDQSINLLISEIESSDVNKFSLAIWGYQISDKFHSTRIF